MGGGEAQKNRADAILMSLIEALSCTWSVFLCVSFCLGGLERLCKLHVLHW